MAEARDQRGELLQLESQVRRARISEAKRLKGLESENAKLKKLFADAMLDNAALGQNSSSPWINSMWQCQWEPIMSANISWQYGHSQWRRARIERYS